MPDICFDPDLIARYDRPGPRYTSYPTALNFDERYGENDYRRNAERSNASGRGLSLYVHLPFCSTICYYCACNKVVTRDRSRALPYLEHLEREIALQGALFDSARPVTQLHWGGGTPTFIDHGQMRALMETTRRHFNLEEAEAREFSIEIDPREIDREGIRVLRDIGFNRLSLGVQDFDPDVQQAVNRIQPEGQTLEALEAARQWGFRSVSVDLIYGLPRQTVGSFARTLERIVEMSPDRVSLFNYAHMPAMFSNQRGIREAELPTPDTKLAILQMSIETLTESGYEYIGMDHFARPTDELALAQKKGGLHRNFQGYATHADCDLVGLGVTAIGTVGNSFAQNVRDLETYYACLENGRLPVFRGVEFTPDDDLRRAVIMQLICHFELDLAAVERAHDVVFADYFARELDALVSLTEDGLVELDGRMIRVTPRGRLLIRNICMVFDRYLGDSPPQERFSRAI